MWEEEPSGLDLQDCEQSFTHVRRQEYPRPLGEQVSEQEHRATNADRYIENAEHGSRRKQGYLLPVHRIQEFLTESGMLLRAPTAPQLIWSTPEILTSLLFPSFTRTLQETSSDSLEACGYELGCIIPDTLS